MANAVETNETPTPTGFDNTDFHQFKKMMADPDAQDAARKEWAKSATSNEASLEVEAEEEEAETEEPNASETEQEAVTTEEEDEEETQGTKDEAPKRKSRSRRRIERLEAEIAALKEQQSKQPAVEAKTETRKGPPKLSEFDYDEDKHAAALEAYLADKVKADTARETLTRENQDRINSYNESEAATKVKYRDYDAVMENVSDLKFGPVAVKALIESDLKAEITYEIAKSPELAERIAELSSSDKAADQLQAVRLIAKVEGRLETAASSVAEARKPPIVSKAPPPGKPLNGKAGAQTRTASDILDEYGSTGDSVKARKLNAEYEKLTGKRII